MFLPGRSSVEHRPSVDCFGKHHADRCSHHLCDSVFPRPVGKVDKLSISGTATLIFLFFIYQQHKTYQWDSNTKTVYQWDCNTKVVSWTAI